MEEDKPLNLDELFGQGRPVKVLWGKEEYALLRPEAFGPKDTLHLARLRRQIHNLQVTNENRGADTIAESQKTADDLEKTLDEALTMLCGSLPVKDIPFVAKLHVLDFYSMETQKNALKAALRQIGASPSAG